MEKISVLHITPSSNGYERVMLIANSVNRKNSLAVIEKDGEQMMSGGFIFEDSPIIEKILDAVPKEEQYKLAELLKRTPFVKFYLED